MTSHRTALWLYAHPSQHSLNQRLFEEGADRLRRTHRVLTSDLYAMGWRPELTEEDLGPLPEDGGTFGARTRTAYERGTLAPEIRREQEKLRAADLLVVQFPLWWAGMPAILKGWFDRVFVNGFAFNVPHPRTGRSLKYGEGGLAGRRALTVVSAGDRESSFAAGGVNGELEALLFPLLHGILWYTGVTPLRPHLVAATDRREFAGLDAERERFFARLAGVEEEEPIRYRTLRHGGYDRDQRLPADAGPHDLGIHRLPPRRAAAVPSAAPVEVPCGSAT